MRYVFALVVVALLAAGCDEEKQSKGPSLEQQKKKELQSELDKIQAQANKSIQKSIATGQNALNSARPRLPR